jgi:hypothetical protein
MLVSAMGVEGCVADSTGEQGAVVKGEDGALVVGEDEQDEEEGTSVVDNVARISGGVDTFEARENGVEEEGLGGRVLMAMRYPTSCTELNEEKTPREHVGEGGLMKSGLGGEAQPFQSLSCCCFIGVSQRHCASMSTPPRRQGKSAFAARRNFKRKLNTAG